MKALLQRPAPGDAAPYYFRYIDLVPPGDVLQTLAGGVGETRRALAKLGPDRETHRYAPGKWSVRDLVGHVLDSERVFGHRAFHIGRGDAAPQPSMEQDDYVATAGAGRRPLTELLEELDLLRRSHLAMFAAFDSAAWERVGSAAGNPVRVRAFPFILAGHEIHHRRVLLERYLGEGERR
jgi:uncharacterized damage-inducible protein DinB